MICGRVIPISAAKNLLAVGRSQVLEGFVSKNGKPFDAYLKMEDGKAVFAFKNNKNYVNNKEE